MYLKKSKTQAEATARANTVQKKMENRLTTKLQRGGKMPGPRKMVREEMRLLRIENPKHLGGLKSPIKRKDSIKAAKARSYK